MTEQKLFAFAIGALKGFSPYIRSFRAVSVMPSPSQQECEAEAMQMCLRAYPASEGHMEHWAIANEIPKDILVKQP